MTYKTTHSLLRGLSIVSSFVLACWLAGAATAGAQPASSRVLMPQPPGSSGGYAWGFDEPPGPALASEGGEVGQYGRSTYRIQGLVGQGAVELGMSELYDADSYVDFGPAPVRLGRGDFTIMHWYRTRFSMRSMHGDVVGNRQAPGHGNYVSVRLRGDGTLTYEVDDDGGDYVEATSGARTINDGRWHHLAYTRRGPTITLYVDGKPAGSATAASGMAAELAGITPLRLGRSLPNCCRDFATIPANGDELRVYFRELSPAEIAKHYFAVPTSRQNEELSPRGTVLAPPPSPIANTCHLEQVCAPCARRPDGQAVGNCPCATGYFDLAHLPCDPKK